MIRGIKIALSFFTLFIGLQAYSQVAAPSLRCISVNPNGSITLNWVPPNDPLNQFVTYVVGTSTAVGGPYNEVTAGPLALNSFTIPVNANLNSFFAYVRTVYNNGTGGTDSSQSVILRSIFPQITANTDTTASIIWNPIATPNLGTNLGFYTIFRQIGNGPWVNLGTSNYGFESWNDDGFKVCSDTVRYRIETQDISGCISVSSVVEGNFEDITPPQTPIVDSITVNPNTCHVSLHWRPSTSEDTWGYVIYYYDTINGVYVTRDTIIGRFSTTFIDSLINTSTDAHQYAVAAFDTCLRGIPPTSNTSSIDSEHKTVHLKIEPDYCGASVSLTWNNYIGWDDLHHYDVYMSTNNQAFKLLDTVGFPDTTYTVIDVDLRNVLCFFVRARNEDKTKSSSSCKVCALSTATIVPDLHHLARVSVVDNDSVEAFFYTDSTISASAYVLLRSLRKDGVYMEVARLPYTGRSQMTMYDGSARVSETDYYYKVMIEDSCGFEIATSNIAKTIHLKGIFDKRIYVNRIDWNEYFGWDSLGNGVETYELYRLTGDFQVPELIYSSESDMYYVDEMLPLITEGLHVCYEVKAIQDIENVFGIQEESLSNRVCLGDNLVLWVPNAFAPNRVNQIFKPVIAFGDYRNYKLTIFSRLGDVLFESTDIDIGWNGESNGIRAEPGAYVWQIEINNVAGERIYERGSVILLR